VGENNVFYYFAVYNFIYLKKNLGEISMSLLRILLAAMLITMMSCSDDKNNDNPDNGVVIDDEKDDDTDNEGTFDNGTVTVVADGTTYSINDFGSDSYTGQSWITGKDGTDKIAAIVVKSKDLEKSLNVTLSDVPADKESFSGQFDASTSIIGYTEGLLSITMESGTVEVDEFDKDGTTKLTVNGTGNIIEMGNPDNNKMGVDIELSVDVKSAKIVIDGIEK